jgi:hypothetical protein
MVDAAIRESKSGIFKHFVYSICPQSILRKIINHDYKRLDLGIIKLKTNKFDKTGRIV